MNEDLLLELYTRPSCSDCQAAKEYLAEENIDYIDKNVGEDQSFEEEMKELSGSRIVPFFAFYKKGLLGRKRPVKNLIGFEVNRKEIEQLVGKIK
ncbi:glutaredoxin family protein [Rossellomorea aquimaris]|uniref:glutaredoxin family protein n=1 Tax=Rossellomorea aquimaris TaxID=189382 RepID=UPI001CD584E4|nr:glutaredoxin family protein [Rossellomorea aquimaris]MCA1055708.1 glutaredoxin family protein [Rossellomorea aquimaris]